MALLTFLKCANNAKNVKNATVCFDGRFGDDGVTGRSD